MRRSPDVSPRRLSDISPQLRQLKYLVVDEAIKEDLKWSRSVEDLSGGSAGLTCIEERILRITGYYGYQPWAASYKSKTPRRVSRVCGRVSPGVVPAASGARAAAQPAGAELALQLLGRGLETRVPPDPWECPTHLLPPPHPHASLPVSAGRGGVTVRGHWELDPRWEALLPRSQRPQTVRGPGLRPARPLGPDAGGEARAPPFARVLPGPPAELRRLVLGPVETGGRCQQEQLRLPFTSGPAAAFGSAGISLAGVACVICACGGHFFPRLWKGALGCKSSRHL